MQMRQKSRTDGFTLVELLVVIAIIGILAAIIVAALGPAMGRGQKTACLADLNQMQTALSLYEDENRDYPPSSLKELGLKHENNINSGVESLVACLSSTAHQSTYFTFKDDKLDNTDSDKSPIPLKQLTGSAFTNDNLWEFIDPWGNPLIYFHYRDLTKETKAKYVINGEKIEVGPDLTATKTGKIHGYGEYQIISCGIDMQPATDDDLLVPQ